jgi:putative transposase
VRKVLIGAGVPPAAERASLSWRAFLRQQAASALACDFLTVIRTPIRAPNANAFAERWVRTLRADCLDRILILGRRHLEHVLGVYRRHYNEHRPHRALDLQPPDGASPLKQATATERVRRRDLLGGMIHEYRAAA